MCDQSLKPFAVPSRRLQFCVFVLVFAVGMLFALYTRNAWEDWYITYRASKNLALGNGLVFNPGQRVHSFTSPLGTLVPALLSYSTGNTSDDLVLWLYRIVSCCFLGGTALLMLRVAVSRNLSAAACIALIGLLCVDAKTVGFSISGMETAFLVFFLALSYFALTVAGSKQALLLGIAWGGLMWTRPDGFIYAIGIALGFLVFPQAMTADRKRRDVVTLYAQAATVGILLYLPWFLWAWMYYGTPVPHTIVAKGLHSLINYRSRLWYYPLTYRKDLTFTPAYVGFGGWSKGLNLYGPVALACAWYWVLPKARPLGRAASLAFLVAHVYMNVFVPVPAPWYQPAVAFSGFLVLAHIVQDVVDMLTRRFSLRPGLQTAVPALLIAGHLWVFLAVAYQLRFQESIIEQSNRKQIGLWLHDHAATPHDTVMMECLGYIGFYSNLKTYDSPGMSSPEMVAARRKLNTDDWVPIIHYLLPDWLVLRPNEEKHLHAEDPLLLTHLYKSTRIFDVSARVADVPGLPGRPWLFVDQKFTIYHRKR